METNSDCFWVLFLASKCKYFSYQNSIVLVVFVCMAWLAMALCFWFFPGGPAWGKYNWLTKKASSNAIPGPRGFPIVGSMNLMVNLAHHKLCAAAKSFGAKRLMAFSLGETRVIITCNPDVAKEILNSSVFGDRPVKESAYSLMFNRAIGFAPYGVYWRTLRRIAATHLFCPKQISSTEAQRLDIASQMVSIIACCRGEFSVRHLLKKASLNNMMSSVFGSKYHLGSSNPETEELSQLVEEGYDLLGKLNWFDHLPWLGGLDIQKIRLRCSELVPRVNNFVNKIIQEHKLRIGAKNHDFVDVLLSLNGSDRLSENDMIAVLWVRNKLIGNCHDNS
ncbi:Cytochrome P450 78A6 [Hibiscus syriacus]|uniref:Cytochrome P450 78A6 n=1 Tax=Hibiscus syriacus TaxID=106335 RepID=A0A6A2WNI4_HIBSY|nr:cytochrome P450 78A9-like [Hibiscus syriacus]KAE8662013.1 Cytochrome P450 78A6 [Hibiscus syriacus]